MRVSSCYKGRHAACPVSAMSSTSCWQLGLKQQLFQEVRPLFNRRITLDPRLTSLKGSFLLCSITGDLPKFQSDLRQ